MKVGESMVLERLDAAIQDIARTEKWNGGDWVMGGGKRAYEIYGEGGTEEGEIIWNVNKECRE